MKPNICLKDLNISERPQYLLTLLVQFYKLQSPGVKPNTAAEDQT